MLLKPALLLLGTLLLTSSAVFANTLKCKATCIAIQASFNIDEYFLKEVKNYVVKLDTNKYATEYDCKKRALALLREKCSESAMPYAGMLVDHFTEVQAEMLGLKVKGRYIKDWQTVRRDTLECI